MRKRSRLLSALDAYKARDFKVEKYKTLQWTARKQKLASAGQIQPFLAARFKLSEDANQMNREEGGRMNISSITSPAISGSITPQTVQGNITPQSIAMEQTSDDSSEVNEQSDLEAVQDGIPLSDIENLSADEDHDLVPYQRLTINNTSALLKAHKSIAIPTCSVTFSDHQTVVSAAPTSILDVHDDLNRELAFHSQCLEAVTEARTLLRKENVKFSRPTDYFAEMVKTDDHMEKIKTKIREAATDKKAAVEARRQRDLKKFGKQVQVAKLQERDKARRETMNKIHVLKRKRRDTDPVNAQEEDLFDVALENANRLDRLGRGGRPPMRGKRQKKDAKFGFGGKKRFSKSGDAMSSGDLRGFLTEKSDRKKGSSRLGKSQRAKVTRL